MIAMKDLAEKLSAVERRISDARGEFTLFGLFQVEAAPNFWHLVVAASWADAETTLPVLKYMDRELKKDLTIDELVKISRIVILPADFEELEELAEEHPVEHGKVIVRNREFGLQTIEKAYLITCRPPVVKAA